MPQIHLKHIITIIIICFTSTIHLVSNGQSFGGNPGNIKWRQINSDTVRIIFPKGLEQQANRIALLIHQIQSTQDNSIGNSIKKINIVLQNYTTISNGYVGLAPYRSEYFLNTPQNPFELGTTNWIDNLTMHEWRHVQQYSNFNRGLSKLVTTILGEQGQALANSTAVPDWFFEGDAVLNETKLSAGGRGRLPYFFSGFKSIALNNLQYDYMQLRNGSLKKNIPNHYNLGYLLVSYGREKYGTDFWKKVTTDAASFKPLFYPMQGAIKKYSGITFNQFVKNAFAFYSDQWKQEKSDTYEFVTTLKHKDVINYQHPYVTENGNIITLKSSNKKIPAFYSIDKNGTETKIAVKDIGIDDYYSYNNGKIIYASYKPDARWGNKDYSIIKILDAVTGKEETIKGSVRYFSPDISHNSKRIVVIENDLSDSYFSQSKVMIMDRTGTNKVMFHSSGYLYSYPKFSTNDSFVYAIQRSIDGTENSIVKIGNSTMTPIFTTRDNNLGYLQVKGNKVLFTATSDGKDELWSYNETNNKVWRIASISTGLYKGDLLNDSMIIASTPTAYGNKLVRMKLEENTFTSMSSTISDSLYHINFSKYEENNQALNKNTERKFTVSKYHKGAHLFNFHSWRPYYDQPEWSFTIYGENILNTLQSEAAYSYNENERSHQLKYSAIYGGSYIQPYLSVAQTFNRSAVYNVNQLAHWNEFNVSSGVQLPLDLSGGKQYRFLRLFASYNLEQVQWTGITKNVFSNNLFQYLHSGLSYSWQIQKAKQQIFPALAQSINVSYKTMLNRYTANQLLASTNIYLPGLFNNHSLVISAAYQARDTARQYTYSNNIPFSRGYTVVDFPRMWKLSANYHLPLVYPDLGFANIVYFLRVRGNVFYDHTVAKSLRTGNTFPFRTAGAELMFDTKWWNTHPVSFGVRYNHLLDDGLDNKANANLWEFIMPILF